MEIDWRLLFVPTTHIAEIVLRGSVVYLFLFSVLRILRRPSGAIGISDVLVVVLLADAAQNAMADDYRSITEGLILVSTIIGWDYFLNWLGFRFPLIERLIDPPPLLLVRDGEVEWRNLRRQLLTEGELMEKLREHGVERLKDVKRAYLEGDGSVTVITRESGRATHHRRRKRLS